MLARAFLTLAAIASLGCSVEVVVAGKACAADGSCPDDLACIANRCVAGVPALDWSASMVALYRFEDPLQLGIDSSPHARHLMARNAPQSNGVEFAEGRASVDVGTAGGFTSDAAAFQLLPSFTYGGWMRTDVDVGNPSAIRRRVASDGYWLERDSVNEWASCLMANSGGVPGHHTPPDSWPTGTWVHVVCRYDVDVITAFSNGQAVEDTAGVQGVNDDGARFSLSPEIDPFTGQLDEVFFADRGLSDAAIARIHACGVMGTRCACDEQDPFGYADCGRASDCNVLPPCNQSAP